MIEICEEYASEMDLFFNKKSLNYYVYCYATIDVVDSEMYLGNKLYNNIYKTKIDELVCDFERLSNNIIHNLKHILSTYCESFYGCELFNYEFLFVKIVYCNYGN